MVLELRAIKSAVVAFLVSLTLVFVPWEFAVPMFAAVYAGWKYRYYTRRIGKFTPESDHYSPRARYLGMSLLGYVLALVGTRLAAFALFPSDWARSTEVLSDPIVVDLNDPGTLTAQVVPVLLVGGALMLPILVLSFSGSQLRLRLLRGVDTKTAAVRAALWESLARVPLYLLWAGLLAIRPLYDAWSVLPEQIGSTLGVAPGVTDGFSPILSDVFLVVVGVGHVAPAVVVGAYLAMERKYGDGTIPEVLGYRGLYPPSRKATIANVAVPVGVYLLYSVPAVLYNQGSLAVIPLLVVPVVVSILVGADVRGTTTRFVRSSGRRLPLVGDAVVVGLAAGLYVVLALALLEVALGVGLGLDSGAAVLFPVVAVPLTYGTNRVASRLKVGNVEDLAERIEEDPGTVDETAIDRLLAHVHARDDALRVAGIDGLATAAGASSYREDEAIEVFVSAVNSPDERFARPALKGIVKLLGSGRALAALEQLTGIDLLLAVDARLRGAEDPETRELAAAAFARIVAAGFANREVAPPPLSELEDLPIARIEEVVGDEPTDRDLVDAVVTCFAYLWYTAHRSTDEERYSRADLSTTLGGDDEQRLLVDLVRWSGYAGEEPRALAAFALTSDRAIVEGEGLETVIEATDSDDPVVRYMAAHVLESSMPRHVGRIDPGRLLPMLDDEDDQARGAGAEVIYAFVETADDERSRAIVGDLLDHLAGRDPTSGGVAEAAVLRALDLVVPGRLAEYENAAATVAGYVADEDPRISEPASRVLAGLLDVDPEARREGPVMSAIEEGLTHPSDEVREHCVSAAASVIEVDPGDGRPFVEGLVLNLGVSGTVGEIAVSCLSRVLDEHPQYGTEVLPEMVGGLRNPTPVSRQYAGAMIAGKSVSETTAELVADVTEHDVSRGEILIEPLVNLAGNVAGTTREAVFQALMNLSEAYPDESREVIPVAASALDEGSVRVRRNAAEVVANVARRHPDAVRPIVSNLVVAVDDNDSRTRATALLALEAISDDDPEAVQSDIRRIIGRLDDESSIVREHAAEVIVTIAETRPDIVQPAAEASDRLRRLQRDPAVEIESEALQNAASAVQSGTPAGAEPGSGREDTQVWSVEDADQVGSSGDTRVFDPMADEDDDVVSSDTEVFDADSFGDDDEEADDEGTDDEGADDEGTDDEATGVETIIQPDAAEEGGPEEAAPEEGVPAGESPAEGEEEPEPPEAGDREPETEDDESVEVETVIQPDAAEDDEPEPPADEPADPGADAGSSDVEESGPDVQPDELDADDSGDDPLDEAPQVETIIQPDAAGEEVTDGEPADDAEPDEPDDEAADDEAPEPDEPDDEVADEPPESDAEPDDEAADDEAPEPDEPDDDVADESAGSDAETDPNDEVADDEDVEADVDVGTDAEPDDGGEDAGSDESADGESEED